MGRLKLPKPVRLKNPPERIYLYDPKVDLNQQELKEHNQNVFIVTPEGDYQLAPNFNPEDFVPQKVSADNANLVASVCENGKHAPVIDVDIPIYVVPSSQLGHYHLYIEKEISWNSYVRILKALENAGIIEAGYLNASLSRGYTAVRPVGIVKPGSPRGSEVLKENSILRQRVRDLVVEVEHLQKELANGVSDEIINEIKNLRKQNKTLSDDLSVFFSEYEKARSQLETLENKLNEIEVENKNIKVTSDPKAYNATWS